ncbi:CGNR zinc finger domain-containing protein [Micromonospora coxensis]|uniref:CGNR zinc finger domain-containing protein n=1 Tax=Micromonospora coxensis TaxID=356852 RepID=UPI0034356194
MTDGASGLTLTSPEGTRYRFDPGALCLEFLTTGGPGPLARYDVLHQPRDLADWLALSRLRLDPADVDTDADDLALARRLRDALWRIARRRTRGETPEHADLAVVNEAAAAPPLAPQIDAGGGRAWRTPVTGGQALSSIARDAVDLLTGRHADRIRECGAHDCQLVFVDTSRPGQRRWCAMERCGNRQKIRALRARRD